MDKFYKNAQDERVRISFEEGTEKWLQAVVKERIADLHIYFPNSPFDVRISINKEKLVSEEDVTQILQSKALP